MCLRPANDGVCIDCLTRRRRSETSAPWSRLFRPRGRAATVAVLLLLLGPVAIAFAAWLLLYLR